MALGPDLISAQACQKTSKKQNKGRAEPTKNIDALRQAAVISQSKDLDYPVEDELADQMGREDFERE